jgi:hypothetical protein
VNIDKLTLLRDINLVEFSKEKVRKKIEKYKIEKMWLFTHDKLEGKENVLIFGWKTIYIQNER